MRGDVKAGDCAPDTAGDNSLTVGTVIVMGVENEPTDVQVNQASQSFQYNSTAHYLTVDNLDIMINQNFIIVWSWQINRK